MTPVPTLSYNWIQNSTIASFGRCYYCANIDGKMINNNHKLCDICELGENIYLFAINRKYKCRCIECNIGDTKPICDTCRFYENKKFETTYNSYDLSEFKCNQETNEYKCNCPECNPVNDEYKCNCPECNPVNDDEYKCNCSECNPVNDDEYKCNCSECNPANDD